MWMVAPHLAAGTSEAPLRADGGLTSCWLLVAYHHFSGTHQLLSNAIGACFPTAKHV